MSAAAVMMKTIWTTRRGAGMMLILWTALVAGMLYILVADWDINAPTVQYGSLVYTPIDPGPYCPGDVLRYNGVIVVDASEIPAILRVAEGWHNEETGITPRNTVFEYNLPLVRPTDLKLVISRTLPDTLTPGVWWFDHVSVNGHASGYTVGPVEVVACP